MKYLSRMTIQVLTNIFKHLETFKPLDGDLDFVGYR